MNSVKKIFYPYLESHLVKIFLSDKKNLFWIFIASSVTNVLLLTPMLYMLQIFDRIFISKSVLTLLTVSGIIIYFYILSSLSGYIRTQIVISMGIKIEEQVNKKLFFVGFRERLNKDVKNPSSYLDDLTLVRQWLTGPAIFSVFDLPWVPIYVLVMFIMHPILGYTSLVMILILMVFGVFFSKVLGNQDEILRQEEHETNEFLYGKLRNSEVLSVFALASSFKKNWIRNKRKFYVSLNNSQKKTDIIQNVTKQYRFFSNSVALTVGAFLVIYDELTLGSMIAASLLMARTTAPVDTAVAAMSRIGIVREAFWRIEKMLDYKFREEGQLLHLAGEDNIKKVERLAKGIQLKNVAVLYENGEKRVFDDLNIYLEKGQLVSVVGKSGVGKTTFIKLLAGLTHYEGTILFDDNSMEDILSIDTQRFIGYLPQDVLMNPGTVAENIAGLQEPESEQVVKVAKIAGIHEFILKFPGGYDSILTGGYQNLSGGERQRLGLARAIYHDPACLLLDEPNSALDPSGELALKNVIDHCRNSGTLTLVVTHRRSVLAYSDKILDLSNPKSIIFTHREEYLKRFNSKEDFDRRFTL